jgi:hypothetical protein
LSWDGSRRHTLMPELETRSQLVNHRSAITAVLGIDDDRSPSHIYHLVEETD